MNREGAETYLRLMAEAELRRAALAPRGAAGARQAGDLALIAYILSAAGAIDTDEVRSDLYLALLARRTAPVTGTSSGSPAQSPIAEWRRARVLHIQPSRPVAGAFAVSGAGPPASTQAAWRIVPAGRVIRITDGDVRGELHLLAYAQTTAGARFTAAGWLEGPPGAARPGTAPGAPPQRSLPPHLGAARFQFTAVDDQGTSYRLGLTSRRPAGRAPWHGVLELQPDPPREIRWLDLSATSADAAIRIDLDPQVPPPDITVARKPRSPGELLVDVIAARLLSLAATYPQDTPERLAAARPGLVPHVPGGLGDIINALLAAGALPPASVVPGQLARLCESLGVGGHGITASPAADLPEPWLSMLTRYYRRRLYAWPVPGGWAAAAVELPEIDGTRIAVLGLHQDERGTVMHMLASGVTPEDDWAYIRGVGPLPALWIRDSCGRWHATGKYGYGPSRNAGEVMLEPVIVPPLEAGTDWIDVVATGTSAAVRVRVPLRWQSVSEAAEST
jgi:hypothetical protein